MSRPAEPRGWNGWRRWLGSELSKADWLPPLLARLWMGSSFLMSGVYHIGHVRESTAFFAQLHIPGAAFFAPFVGWVEFIFGALLVVGLVTPLTVVPLIAIMIVATFTAKRPTLVQKPGDILTLGEPLYVLLLLWLGISGPGRVSADHRLDRLTETSPPTRIRADPGPGEPHPHAPFPQPV
jgi:putative oxidoreductase